MSDQTLRLAGLAFAGSDLVFEIDSQGRIVFVLGAAARLTGHGERALTGQSWLDLVIDADRGLLDALAEGLKPAERQGPLRIALPLGREPRPPPSVSKRFPPTATRGPSLLRADAGCKGRTGRRFHAPGRADRTRRFSWRGRGPSGRGGQSRT